MDNNCWFQGGDVLMLFLKTPFAPAQFAEFQKQSKLDAHSIVAHPKFVNAGYGWGYTQRPDPNGRHLMFYDNSAATEGVVIRCNVFATAKDSCLRLHGRDWTAALTMDFNCWFQAQGPVWLWGKENVSAERLAAFQKEHNLDAHSLLADPKFVDAARNDYRLAPESPARKLLDDGTPAGALP
jgi:hypothetical protein